RGHPLFQTFARAHTADVLAAWLFDLGLEGLDLKFDDDIDYARATWAALRNVFDEWQIPTDQLNGIFELFSQVRQSDLACNVICKALLPLDPLLAGKLIGAWLNRQRSLGTKPSDLKQYVVGCLLPLAAELPSGASENQIRQRRTDALEEA